jgi:hypothetical protein
VGFFLLYLLDKQLKSIDMEIIGIIFLGVVILIANTLLFNSLIEDLNELKKSIKVLLFIPPFSIIGGLILTVMVLVMYIIDSFKKI